MRYHGDVQTKAGCLQVFGTWVCPEELRGNPDMVCERSVLMCCLVLSGASGCSVVYVIPCVLIPGCVQGRVGWGTGWTDLVLI